MTMADTVAVMNAGKIEQMGSPAELYELPRTAFVANFLGQSNLLPGSVVDSGELVGVDVGGARVLLPASRAVATSGKVLVGVRPEKLHILTDGEEAPAGWNVLPAATLTDVSFMGVSTQFRAEVPGLGTLAVFEQNQHGARRAAPGDTVRLAWDPEYTFGLSGDEDVDDGATTLEGEVQG